MVGHHHNKGRWLHLKHTVLRFYGCGCCLSMAKPSDKGTHGMQTQPPILHYMKIVILLRFEQNTKFVFHYMHHARTQQRYERSLLIDSQSLLYRCISQHKSPQRMVWSDHLSKAVEKVMHTCSSFQRFLPCSQRPVYRTIHWKTLKS